MAPLKSYSLDLKDRLKILEAKGEKVTSYFRWFFTGIVAFILILYYRVHPINRLNVIYVSFVLVPALYNIFLLYIFKNDKYRPFIKYLSMFIDVSIVSTGILVSAYAFSPFYPVTAPTILVYSVILTLCITRIDRRYIIISTFFEVFSYNIVYIIWNLVFSKTIEYSLMMYLGYTHRQQVIKTIFIAILGVISYYTVSILKKFVSNTVEASIKARNAELRLIKQYKIILNNLNIGITIIDINNTVLFINQPLIDMLGYNAKDVIGRNLSELIIPDKKNEDKKIFQFVKNKLEKKRSLQFNISLTAKNGEIIPVQLYISKTYILNDPSYLLTIFDLRKQKALEERLLQSRKMETIGRMASGFAHDFNNLLSIVSEYIYEASESKNILDNSTVEKINSVINRQKELVELLYKISGKMEESEVKLSIKSLFSKIINLLSPVLPENISLYMKSYIDENITFTVNETAILQIIFNLILNAKEAIEPASGKIEVSASITKNHDRNNAVLLPIPRKNQNYLLLTVTDNGPGIPKNIINKIFDPYVSTKSNNDNLRRGLGLSFVYTITEQLNGGISIFTKRNEGTTFKIYIPTEISSKNTNDILNEHQSGGTTKTNEKNTMQNRRTVIETNQNATILYIDDDEDMRAITSRILSRHGFEVKAARNGDEALKLLEKGKYNLIMTDFYLPDIEGDKLILELRKYCNSPIILITGAQSDNIHKIEGVHKVIKKPIEVDVLLETITDAVKS